MANRKTRRVRGDRSRDADVALGRRVIAADSSPAARRASLPENAQLQPIHLGLLQLLQGLGWPEFNVPDVARHVQRRIGGTEELWRRALDVLEPLDVLLLTHRASLELAERIVAANGQPRIAPAPRRPSVLDALVLPGRGM